LVECVSQLPATRDKGMKATSASKIKRRVKNLHNRLTQLFNRQLSRGEKYDLAAPTTVDLIRNKGERATHLHPNDNYTSHLSVYDFAVRFCQGLTVLDAGSGSGYGSAYLAEKGAKRVVGIEVDHDAVRFSKQVFGKIPNLAYQQMNLEKIRGFKQDEFDVIFSSNVLEHVPDVHAFFLEAVQILNSSGKLILAVPEIQDGMVKVIANLNNPFHVNIWTMKQWQHVLEQYFEEVIPYHHSVLSGSTFNSINKPEESNLTLADFEVVEATNPNQRGLLLTAVFLASHPKRKLKNVDRRMIDQSFSVNPPGVVQYDDEGRLCSDIIYSSLTHVGRLTMGVQICQTFVCGRDNLSGIALSVATYTKQIDSTLKLTLLDEHMNTLRETQKSTLDMPNNNFYPFLFDTLAASKGRQFTFCIETVADKGENVTLWTDNQVSNVCTRNGAPVKYGLLYKCCFR
jgi:2-polyprenyl-3-methyl-5-hydroxy-6-metoxy-1,4-benzoquinol methylase